MTAWPWSGSGQFHLINAYNLRSGSSTTEIVVYRQTTKVYSTVYVWVSPEKTPQSVTGHTIGVSMNNQCDRCISIAGEET